MESDEKDDIAVERTNGLPPTLVFRTCSSPHSSLNQDHSALTSFITPHVENECKIRPPSSSPGGLMKRRNSNIANCEKMLQKFTESTSDVCRRDIDENQAILECAKEMFNTEELDNYKVTTRKEDTPECCNPEADGQAKAEDPNQALLQYFAKLSSSGSVEESLDWEHIQSLLHRGLL